MLGEESNPSSIVSYPVYIQRLDKKNSSNDKDNDKEEDNDDDITVFPI